MTGSPDTLASVNLSEDLDKLMAFWPRPVQALLQVDLPDIEEVKLRLGRPLWALVRGKYHRYPYTVTQADLAFVGAKCSIGGAFRDDNRRGIEGTGHRISRVMMADGTPEGAPIGYTFRVGRYFEGIAEPLRPYIEENPSILIIGEAGVGKTSLARGVGKIIGEYYPMQAVSVDTSGELAGYGAVPHAGAGDVDVMPVRSKAMQAQLIEEASKNQNARVLLVDEINREEEAEQIVEALRNNALPMGTTHGRSVKKVSESRKRAPLFYPEPVFYWFALIRERGVVEMMRATEAMQAVAEGREPVGTIVRLGKGI